MRIHVVLVRTEYARNVGSTARAMSNMGADRLILLDRRCAIDEKAKQMAAGAQEKLRERTEYKSWDEFYSREGDGLRIAFTRRGGRNRKVYSIKDKLEEIGDTDIEDLYLIFGPEADGLDHDDLAFVNCACHLPVFGDFASLNLSQAVLLSLYIVRDKLPPARMPEQVTGIQKPIARPFYFPDDLLKKWISAIGFDIGARRASAYLTLRRLFLQNRPTQHELHVLESVLHQNIRKLKESKPAQE